MRYVRRPLLEGGTSVPVFSQPTIRGCNPADATTDEVPGLSLPADLVIETESMGGTPITVTIPVSSTLSDIVDLVDAALDVASDGFAEQQDHCLVIGTNGAGEGAFVRIHPAVNDYDGDPDGLPDDAAPALGLPQYPDPLGTVSAGDLYSSNVRSSTQANPEGTRFIAQGEDRTAQAYNRALSQLASNADHLYTLANTSVAVPTVIEVDSSDAAWTARFSYDADGYLDEIDLSSLSAMDPELDGRLFVGELTRNSTLQEIGRYWNVLDSEGKQLLGWDDTWTDPRRTVRIAAVTRGARAAAKPTFADETTAPTGALLDTQDLTPTADGRNALGVSRLKISGLTISAIRRRTGVVVTLSGADGFETAGVAAGDVAVIAGAAVDTPFNHSGTYIVEVVTSENEIVLRPAGTDDLDGLNPDDSGAYGTLSVYSGGSWESEVSITFDPPLARFPEDGKIRLVVGMERPLGSISEKELALAGVEGLSASPAFALRELWNKLSLGGAYSGMNRGKGGGFLAQVDSRPPTFSHVADSAPSAGTLARGPYSGSIASGNVLIADPTDTFVIADVGRTLRVTGTVEYAKEEEHFTIVEFVDGAHVVIAGGPERMSAELPVEDVTYSVYEDAIVDLQAASRVVLHEAHDGGSAYPNVGHLVQRERVFVDESPPNEGVHGRGYLHLERVKRVNTTALGLPIDAGEIEVVSFVGGNVIEVGFNPEYSHAIRPEQGGDIKTLDGYQVAPTVVRILNGPQAGYYRLDKTQSTAGDYLELLNLDGTTPTLTDPGFTVWIALYNPVFGTNVPLKGRIGTDSVTAAVMAYADGEEQDDSEVAGLGVSWEGPGFGIYGVLNDPEFLAYDTTNEGADGYATYFRGYAPAHGAWYEFDAASSGATARRSARVGTFIGTSYYADLSLLASPLATSSDPQGWAGWVHQGGKDPGFIVTKGGSAGAGPGPVEVTGVPTAALVVQGTSASNVYAYISEAMDSHGAVYNRRGGVWSDSGLAGAWWVTPTYARDVLPEDDVYYEAGYATYLGAPGRIIPSDSTAALASGTLAAPDYTTFPGVQHQAVLTTTSADIKAKLAEMTATRGKYKHLGSYVDIDGGTNYVLVGLNFPGGNTVNMALYRSGASAVGGSTAEDFRILGKRWYHGHLDIGDWFQVGTKLLSGDSSYAWEAPLHTVGVFEYETYERIAASGEATLDVGTEFSLTPHQYFPSVDGVGLGSADVDLATMTNLDVTPANFDVASGWTANPDGPYPGLYETPWTTDSDQPRSPFPNKGVFSATELTAAGQGLSQNVPGSLLVDDVALDHATLVTANGTALAWSGAYGGCLVLCTATGNAGGLTDVARIWLRGVRGLPTVLYGLRSRVVIQWDTNASKDIVVSLRRDDDTAIASYTHSPTINDDKPRVLEHDFTFIDVFDKPSDGVSDASTFDQGVHLCVDIPVHSTNDTFGNPIRLLQVSLEQISRPHRAIGSLEVAGTVRAHSYRYVSPVRGFQSIGPGDVDLLQNSEYGKNYGNSTGSADVVQTWYGELEGRDVGLIDVDGGPTWIRPTFQREMFFRKGTHSAAIVGYHPYFDPFFYVFATAAAASVVPARLVLPGRTGFYIPLDPPHGARLSSFRCNLSFLPCFEGADANFQVWSSMAGLDLYAANQATNFNDWQTKTTWDGVEGVVVNLFRYNALDFDVEMEDSYPGSDTAEHGYSEHIWGTTISLSSESEATFGANAAGASAGAGAGDGYSTETFVNRGYNLPNEIVDGGGKDPACLIVDRRHYAYFATVEFYIGRRTVNAAEYIYSDLEDEIVSQAHTVTGLGDIQGVSVPYPLDNLVRPWPATVKFRGARLGWGTDRGGHGGWG